MKRRTFLKNSGLASTALFVPSFLNEFNQGLPKRPDKILVIIQLSGGNDGLNTIVPYQNDLYYKNRPQIAITKQKVLKTKEDLGFHPAMSAFKDLYDDGLVSIINSVGYPNPNRSHFRSMDIWHTASDSKEYLSTGWLGRYLDNDCDNCSPLQALEADDSLSLALKGETRKGFSASDAKRLFQTTRNRFLQAVANHEDHRGNENVGYLYKTLVEAQSSAQYLFEQSKKYKSSISYPHTPLGKDLKAVAELIMAHTDTKVYYVSMTGFDTHANQPGRQERLLKTYSEAVSAFVKDLKINHFLNDTLILTFSEFGRRVKQNASRGTDHGTANNLFLINGRLRNPGFFNEAPNLQQLDKGDLQFQIDFRQVYATILEEWLQTNSKTVLTKQFPKLSVL